MPHLEQVQEALTHEEDDFTTRTFLGVGQYAGRKTVRVTNDTFRCDATIMEDTTGTYIRIEAVLPNGTLIFWKS